MHSDKHEMVIFNGGTPILIRIQKQDGNYSKVEVSEDVYHYIRTLENYINKEKNKKIKLSRYKSEFRSKYR